MYSLIMKRLLWRCISLIILSPVVLQGSRPGYSSALLSSVVMIEALCIAPAFHVTLFCMVQVCDDRCDNMVQHDCLTYEGQSGSAMWSSNDQSVRGIVTGARTLSDGTTQNVGIKFNAFVYNTVSAWYNEDTSEPLALASVAPSASMAAPMGAPLGARLAAPMGAPKGPCSPKGRSCKQPGAEPVPTPRGYVY